jgi:hypothetical protein
MTNGDPAQPMIDWVNNVEVADLGAELMAGFGPSGPRDENNFVTHKRLAEWLFRVHGYPPPKRPFSGVWIASDAPILEAMQLLELAALICLRFINDGGYKYWVETRLGLATLASGKAAVRQRIKDRTGQ